MEPMQKSIGNFREISLSEKCENIVPVFGDPSCAFRVSISDLN
jgi:hypothetical protein